jgi:uncharacterized damage-inducible protein DinB
MKLIDYLRERQKHNVWGNNLVLEAASALSDSELLAPREGTSYGSLAADMQHVIDGQDFWVSVISGAPDTSPSPGPPDADVIAGLRAKFAVSNAALDALLASLTDDGLEETASLPLRDGGVLTHTIWRMLEHVLTHGAQHRGEIGMALYKVDKSPGDMDFLDYVESTQGAAP